MDYKGGQIELLPSTMASIWVAFFSFCCESFLLLRILREVLVLPLGMDWISKTLAVFGLSLACPFFSVFVGLSKGKSRVELMHWLEVAGMTNWWLLSRAGLCLVFSGGLVLDTISISISST